MSVNCSLGRLYRRKRSSRLPTDPPALMRMSPERPHGRLYGRAIMTAILSGAVLRVEAATAPSEGHDRGAQRIRA
jgi:hypothetical protein